MSVITVVKKDDQIAIAGDSLVTFGDRRCDRSMLVDSKIYQLNGSYLGLVGYCAHNRVLDSLIRAHPEKFKFGSKMEIFESLQKLHPILKEEYHLDPSEGGSQPYESSQFCFLIANRNGIFEVDTYREVFEYRTYWSIGAGSSYALGAMHAIYDDPNYDAETIAYGGVEAASKFSSSCSLPVDLYSINLKEIRGSGKRVLATR